jgi:hypothetical protein
MDSKSGDFITKERERDNNERETEEREEERRIKH